MNKSGLLIDSKNISFLLSEQLSLETPNTNLVLRKCCDVYV